MRFGEVSSNTAIENLWTSGVENANFRHVNNGETVTLKTGEGTLCRVTINDPGGRLELFDNTVSGANRIANIDCSTPRTLEYHTKFNTGLTYVSNNRVRSVTIIFM